MNNITASPGIIKTIFFTYLKYRQKRKFLYFVIFVIKLNRLSMKRIAGILAFAIVLIMAVPSCKKYEDGPAVSLLSAKKRVSGTWNCYKYMINGQDSTARYITGTAGLKVEIAKDGLYTMSGNFSDQGLWRFEDDKESIVFRSSDPASTEEEKYKIKRLKNNDFWIFRDYGNGFTVELRFKP
jgi:hypothetical protein